ncbi:MAG: ammonium transporter [Alphaproteobacteria bacterium]|jgi:Amt family ammonium transporter|nr:ammonium transporter [Alphaproteobacteria bacterium]MBT5663458.1 ammonium transporter [Alphaproteobacteria bacterium]
MKNLIKKVLVIAGFSCLVFTGTANAEVSAETAYVFNTFSFLVHGFLVMLMALGFTCLEAGLVRTKNTATICLKNVALYSLAGIMFYLIGYGLMYNDVNGYIGSAALWNPETTVDSGDGYSKMSDWFFQMVFCATAMSIVSGTIAERIKLVPFLIFAIFLTGIIYPIQGSWTWGGGWLSEMGFSDFAGSTIVHSVGGWAALTGALIIGPRIGKYGPNGQVNAIPGSNLPLATIGTFILWFGWFGFNGGSQLALGSAADAAAIANVYVNTNMAACAGLVAALILSILLYKKTDLTFVLNGALAGLVAITAGPDVATPLQAMIIGAIGGILTTLAIPLLDKIGIDDVVGAISVHLVSGIWGTLAVAIPGLNGSGDIGTQIIGIVSIGLFTVILSGIGWFALKAIYGLRPSEEEENIGLDISELGMDAYPEFKN